MLIRSISEAELDSFSNVGGFADDYLKQILPPLWAAGQSRPQWCYVLENGNHEWIGRVAFYRIGEAITFEWLVLPWEMDYLEAGHQLLSTALTELHAQGFTQLRRYVPSSLEHVEKWHSLLEHIGMHVQREKVAFRWHAVGLLPSPRRPLVFRALEEVGKEAYLDALRRVMEGTLDQVDQQERLRIGPDVQAQNAFQMLQNSFFSRPQWWQLAYLPENELVGLLMPVLFDKGGDEGTIGYIGVVPELRGQGYIDELLIQCTATLQAVGATGIFADTDRRNYPMIQSFGRVGYQPAGSGTEFLAELTHLGPS
jgi:RimJ/RimL family protein N-acetyltransferase